MIALLLIFILICFMFGSYIIIDFSIKACNTIRRKITNKAKTNCNYNQIIYLPKED